MTTAQHRLDQLHALTVEARATAQHPQYAHGDVSAAILAYVCDAVPEDTWQAAVQYARDVCVDRAGVA